MGDRAAAGFEERPSAELAAADTQACLPLAGDLCTRELIEPRDARALRCPVARQPLRLVARRARGEIVAILWMKHVERGIRRKRIALVGHRRIDCVEQEAP